MSKKGNDVGPAFEYCVDIYGAVACVYSQEFEWKEEPSVSVIINKKKVLVIVEQMYAYVDCSLKKLMALAEIFGTMDYQVDQRWSNGCETCDYGSSYKKQFTYSTPEHLKIYFEGKSNQFFEYRGKKS